ncbi:CRAL-TRIO domain-containing protein [Phycomyces nitens]|nr:CRAL-TRIO domain-containing protein [Phycomyces nitens]
MSANNTLSTNPIPETQQGHVGNLTASQTSELKELWVRLIELFKQPGTEYIPTKAEESTEPSKKSGFFGFGKEKKEEPATDIFLGATSDPALMTLPLDKAIALIPGSTLSKTFWNLVATDNPDAVLLRYLRARKWNIDAAYKMVISTLRWRIVMRLDDIIALGETGMRDELERLKPGLGKSFIGQVHSGKATLGGPDKFGRGVCFINVRFHSKEAQSAEILKLMTLFVMEASRIVVAQPIEANCIVFNMDGFTLSNMDYDFVKFLLTCFEAYYPETLGMCIIHKAPWVFSTVWSIINPLLDPVVASKIHFTKSLKELSEYIPIPNLPATVTGDKNDPSKDELDTQVISKPGSLAPPNSPAFHNYQNTIRVYEQKTLEWAKEPVAEDQADYSSRRELARQYRMDRIKAESSIRGRTCYHEKGLVRITPDNRLILDFGTAEAPPCDITERV